MIRRSLLATALTILAAAPLSPQDEARTSSVGVAVEIRDLVLPGSELEVRASDHTTPVALRIAEVNPHGNALRYDLVYYGLEPGEYDLRDYLARRDGTSTEDLPAIPVTVTSVLPPGQVVPNPVPEGELPRLGGYRLVLWIGGTLWVVGLAVILARTRRQREAEREAARPLTLAERLRPLVEAAQAGTLSDAERAELELGLIAYWRGKLDLRDLRAADAIATLRAHPEAGPLLRALEDWLHRPVPSTDSDVSELLAPYRHLPADALDEASLNDAEEG